MHKTKKNQGFTLAEMLLTVGIIVILFGVAFIAVISYLRRLAQLERDGIAKEIFIAAQNHLTMAEGEGFLGMNESAFGIKETPGAGSADTYYFAVHKGSGYSENSLVGLMLPFGSVDETVRAGGSYIVRYQKNPALVLDVFYCSAAGTRFGLNLTAENYNAILALRDTAVSNKNARRSYGSTRAVVGWYGSEEANRLRDEASEIAAPEIIVTNADTLSVRVTNPAANSSISGIRIRLMIEGVSSGASGYFDPGTAWTGGQHHTFTLDDITTSGGQFANINADAVSGNFVNFHLKREGGKFIPGEDLRVYAVAVRTDGLSNIASSETKTVNSLFADISDSDNDKVNDTASVNSFRHLQNLNAKVSQLDANDTNTLNITKAVQTADLDWKDNSAAAGGVNWTSKSIYQYGANTASTAAGRWLPVDPSQGAALADMALNYDGQGNSIRGLTVNAPGDAGLFEKLIAGSEAQNLELLDFRVSSTGGNAGALAGRVTGTKVTNVLARSSAAESGAGGTPDADSFKPTVNASGSAGGLIGSANGNSTVTSCAAALCVSSTGSGGNAGGLIGSMSGGKVTTSYAGGHTDGGRYSTGSGSSATPLYNIQASSGSAGGLIGSSSSVTVEHSYSTCSAKGAAAGGFIGSASGGRVTGSYCTGLVAGSTESTAGAFYGSASGLAQAASDKNHYFMIVNERLPAAAGQGVTYMAPVGGTGGSTSSIGISAFDADAKSYQDFIGSKWYPAESYDDTLKSYYQNRYNLPTVRQLRGDTTDMTGFVTTHYGDWPAPEILVPN